MNFRSRSYKKELLDRNDIPFDDIRRNMQELNFINTHLGGHKITIDGVKKVLGVEGKGDLPVLHICEIGCGGGDNLAAIHKWCKTKNIEVRFTGIDINPDCITIAKARLAGTNARFLESDYILTDFGSQYPDIIFSSLFCHHFTNDALVLMLRWMSVNSKIGFFINDLNRHPLAFYSIKFLTSIFSRSYLVKNDAPLSVLRGFKRNEWVELFQSAQIRNYSINWKWAFRHLVTVINGNTNQEDLPLGKQ